MATIRTHTTLRTLFATTTVFALLAAAFTAGPRDEFLHGAVTSCTIAFVAGLFGFSFWATFFIALATAFAFDAFFLGSFRWRDAPSAWVMRQALNSLPIVAFLSVTPWLTAWWWGTYLRCQWSKPAHLLEPIMHEVHDSQNDEHLSLRERLHARVEITPIGIFIITVLGNIIVFMILCALTVLASRR